MINYLIGLFKVMFVECTDFVINLSNFFDLSYYEVNFIIFCIIYPVMVVSSFFLFFIQKYRLYNLKKIKN